jgi:hypothetical protein
VVVSSRARLLILCKTYPSPSSQYVETSCVASTTEGGELVRLYPVPFRLMQDEAQFRKWQWIEADIEKPRADQRPESHRIRIDNLKICGAPLSTAHDWAARRVWLDRLPLYTSFADLDAARVSKGTTLGLLKPSLITSLLIVPSRQTDWTDEERAKLLQAQNQGDLFRETEQDLATLEKIPFDFYYLYKDPGGTEWKHKISDWEAGALYRKVVRSHGEDWEKPFREKFATMLPHADLMFLMGTLHRFPDQWLIVSVIYPPKRLQQPLL